MDEQIVAPKLVVANFQINCDLSTARKFTVTGYIFDSDTPKDIRQRINAFQDVCDEQGIRMDIVAKEAQKAQHVVMLQQHQELVADLVDKRKAGKTLTGQEKQAINNLDATLLKGREMIESLEAAIAAARKRLNGAAPPAA